MKDPAVLGQGGYCAIHQGNHSVDNFYSYLLVKKLHLGS